MNMNIHGYQTYKRTQIQTADQGRLILMCYDGAIGFLKQAQKAHADKNYKLVNELLNRTQNVLWELTNGLYYEAGEVAYHLDSLYNYMIRRIVDAAYNNTIEPAHEVVGYLEELRETWQNILQKQS